MLEIHGPLTVPAACQSRGVSPYQNKSTALHGQGRALSPAAAAAPADARGRPFSPPARGCAARRAPGTPSPALSHLPVSLPPPSRIILAGRRLTRHTRRCGAVCAALPQPQGSRPARSRRWTPLALGIPKAPHCCRAPGSQDSTLYLSSLHLLPGHQLYAVQHSLIAAGRRCQLPGEHRLCCLAPGQVVGSLFLERCHPSQLSPGDLRLHGARRVIMLA